MISYRNVVHTIQYCDILLYTISCNKIQHNIKEDKHGQYNIKEDKDGQYNIKEDEMDSII